MKYLGLALFCGIVGVWNMNSYNNTGAFIHLICSIGMAICVWVNLLNWWKDRQ